MQAVCSHLASDNDIAKRVTDAPSFCDMGALAPMSVRIKNRENKRACFIDFLFGRTRRPRTPPKMTYQKHKPFRNFEVTLCRACRESFDPTFLKVGSSKAEPWSRLARREIPLLTKCRHIMSGLPRKFRSSLFKGLRVPRAGPLGALRRVRNPHV